MEQGLTQKNWLTTLIDNIGALGSAKTAFGDPVFHGDVTVIPVGRVRYGGGGGGGKEMKNKGEGTEKSKSEIGAGGGGGVNITPVGFIAITKDKAQFHRILDLTSAMQVILTVGISMWLTMRGARALIRA